MGKRVYPAQVQTTPERGELGAWVYLGFRIANAAMALTRRLTSDDQPE